MAATCLSGIILHTGIRAYHDVFADKSSLIDIRLPKRLSLAATQTQSSRYNLSE